MLLYSMLHLTGVKAVDPDYKTVGNPSVPLDDLKALRQFDCRRHGIRNIVGTSRCMNHNGPLDSHKRWNGYRHK
jgi:transketolase